MSPEIACDHRLSSQGLADVFIKMRLPFEVRPNRPAAYRFSDKMLSLALILLRYYTAHRYHVLDVIMVASPP